MNEPAANSVDQRSVPACGANPLADAKRSSRISRVVGAAAVIGAGAWAGWPLAPARVQVQETRTPDPQSRLAGGTAPLDLDAFERPLWTISAAPEPPPTPHAVAPPPPPPPPPLRLQLLGISRQATVNGDLYRAALYDPDTDRILIVANGDKAGDRLVQSVASDRITLALGAQTQILLLRSDQPDAAGGGTP